MSTLFPSYDWLNHLLSFLSRVTYDAIDLILFSGVEKYVQWESALKSVRYTDKARYRLE